MRRGRTTFHFDTVQMPLNVMDAHFRSFGHKCCRCWCAEGIAPLGMKAFGDHFILDSKTVTPIECLHYCLNLPTSVQINGHRQPGGAGSGAGGSADVQADV